MFQTMNWIVSGAIALGLVLIVRGGAKSDGDGSGEDRMGGAMQVIVGIVVMGVAVVVWIVLFGLAHM